MLRKDILKYRTDLIVIQELVTKDPKLSDHIYSQFKAIKCFKCWACPTEAKAKYWLCRYFSIRREKYIICLNYGLFESNCSIF